MKHSISWGFFHPFSFSTSLLYAHSRLLNVATWRKQRRVSGFSRESENCVTENKSAGVETMDLKRENSRYERARFIVVF